MKKVLVSALLIATQFVAAIAQGQQFHAIDTAAISAKIAAYKDALEDGEMTESEVAWLVSSHASLEKMKIISSGLPTAPGIELEDFKKYEELLSAGKMTQAEYLWLVDSNLTVIDMIQRNHGVEKDSL